MPPLYKKKEEVNMIQAMHCLVLLCAIYWYCVWIVQNADAELFVAHFCNDHECRFMFMTSCFLQFYFAGILPSVSCFFLCIFIIYFGDSFIANFSA